MKRTRSVAVVMVSVLLVASCASDPAGSDGGTGGGGATGGAGGGMSTGGGGGDAMDGGTGGGSTDDGGTDGGAADAGCVDGATCGDAGVCVSGACCDVGKACGAACCASAEVCSFQRCVAPGATCLDATECDAGQYCDYALDGGFQAGAPDASVCPGALATGLCLPLPPSCAAGMDAGAGTTCLASCEVQPPAGQFSPVLKYAWGDPAAPNTQDSVMMTPVVVQLDDDTCDGVVDARDIPEIVFFAFASGNYNGNGTLHAISIVNGAVVEKWAANAGLASPNHPGRSIAAGNIDGVPGNEIVVCTTDGRARAYTAVGTQLWLSPPGTCAMPAIADLDQDGWPDVITESQILDGRTGMPKVAAFTPSNTGNLVPSDLDGNGTLELVGPDRAYLANGTQLVSTGVAGRYVAVGDLDKNGTPEVIVTDYDTHSLIIWHLDSSAANGVAIVRQGLDINGPLSPALCAPGSAGNTRGGGPPTVADFNGDGFPDVGLAGGVGYAVFDGAKLMNPAVPDADTFLWVRQTQDCSSAATGSSAFDFDGDGKAEVVYGDEVRLHVYDGATGNELFQTCNTNATLFEYPLVADVDHDGQADLVAVSNSYSGFACAGVKTSGVRIFGDANGHWVHARSVWNEHAYHVTNVNDDGSIPAVEAANPLQPRLDNFRQNGPVAGELSAPDLVVSIGPRCAVSPYALVAHVQNLGSAPVPAGVPVGFYLGDPLSGGVALPGSPLTTSHVLYPAESEDVVLSLPNPPAGVQDASTPLFAVVDDQGMHAWRECRADNNTSTPGSGQCPGSP